jgi:hypothetical protein
VHTKFTGLNIRKVNKIFNSEVFIVAIGCDFISPIFITCCFFIFVVLKQNLNIPTILLFFFCPIAENLAEVLRLGKVAHFSTRHRPVNYGCSVPSLRTKKTLRTLGLLLWNLIRIITILMEMEIFSQPSQVLQNIVSLC